MLSLALLGGCDNSTPETTATTRETIDIRKPVDDDTLRAMSFLNITDGDLAARWLVLRERQDDGSRVPSSEEIGEYARRIEQLAKLLVEDRRMIANRTVQTRDLLAERNVQETLPRLLDGMERVAQLHIPGNYGAYCDWYINLRTAGLTHEQAFDRMTGLKESPRRDAEPERPE
jgi:hypothetical protein